MGIEAIQYHELSGGQDQRATQIPGVELDRYTSLKMASPLPETRILRVRISS